MSESTAPENIIQFSAIGLVSATYQPSSDPISGSLILEDGTKVKAVIIRLLRRKILKNPDFIKTLTDSPRLWRIYPKTSLKGRLSFVNILAAKSPEDCSESEINLIQIKGISVPAIERRSQMGLLIQPQADRRSPFTLVVNGEVPEYFPDQFWQVQAGIDRGYLQYIEGKCLQEKYQPTSQENNGDRSSGNKNVSTATIAETQINKKLVAENINSGLKQSSPSKITQDLGEIIMISGRIPELTVKFDTRPDCPETGKKVTIQIVGENGITVRATLNRKTLKKQVEKMDSFEQWVGALSGKMSKIGDDGVIELEGVGLTVFEKKTKNKPAPEAEEKVAS